MYLICPLFFEKFRLVYVTHLGVGEPGPPGRPAVSAPVPVAGHAAPAVARHGAHVVLGVFGRVGVSHAEDLAPLGVGHVEEPVGGGDLEVVVVGALRGEIERIQGESGVPAPGLGQLLFLSFHNLPGSAWADGSLAELSRQLGKIMEHLNQSRPNPPYNLRNFEIHVNVCMIV